MSKYDDAKKIYFDYSGNIFFMDRDGISEKYRGYNVPKKIEKAWDEELKKDIIAHIKKEKNMRKFSNEMLNFYFLTERLKSFDDLMFIYSFSVKKREKYDTFTNILLSEMLLSLTKTFQNIHRKEVKQIKDDMLNYLNLMLKENITLSKDYFYNGIRPEYISDTKIKKRIENKIKEYSK